LLFLFVVNTQALQAPIIERNPVIDEPSQRLLFHTEHSQKKGAHT